MAAQDVVTPVDLDADVRTDIVETAVGSRGVGPRHEALTHVGHHHDPDVVAGPLVPSAPEKGLPDVAPARLVSRRRRLRSFTALLRHVVAVRGKGAIDLP